MTASRAVLVELCEGTPERGAGGLRWKLGEGMRGHGVVERQIPVVYSSRQVRKRGKGGGLRIRESATSVVTVARHHDSGLAIEPDGKRGGRRLPVEGECIAE